MDARFTHSEDVVGSDDDHDDDVVVDVVVVVVVAALLIIITSHPSPPSPATSRPLQCPRPSLSVMTLATRSLFSGMCLCLIQSYARRPYPQTTLVAWSLQTLNKKPV